MEMIDSFKYVLFVVKGEQRLQMQVELSQGVTGSVVYREVITISCGYHMIPFCHWSMSDTAEKGGVC